MKRNQVIDIAKLLCCICVLLNHTSNLKNGIGDGYPVLMQYGFLSVEFFFIVSGFLMTKKAFTDTSDNLGTSTLSFIIRKVTIIYPFFFIAWLIAFIVDAFIKHSVVKEIIVHLLMALPSNLFLEMTGIPSYNVLAPTWYLSAMIICLVVLFPLAKKEKEAFCFIISPLFFFASYAYIAEKVGNLGFIEPVADGVIHIGLLRGVAGISLGSLSYGLCEKLKAVPLSKRGHTFCTLAEVTSYFCAIGLMFSQSRFRPDFIVVFFFFVAVTISFSNTSYTACLFKKEHPLIGQYSLTLYLCDAPARAITKFVFTDFNRMQQIIPSFTITFVLATIVLILGNLLKKCVTNFSTKLVIEPVALDK